MLGHGVATPVLPALATELGGAAADVGLALAAFGAARLALNLPVGAAVNRVGRKPVLVAGATMSALGMAASGLAVDVSSFLAARLVAGAGASCYLGAVQVYLADVAPKGASARVLGANHAALLCGISLGPVIGGLAADALGLRAPFVIVSALNAAAAIHASSSLRETRPAPSGDATTDETMDDDVSSTTLRGTGSPPLETGWRAAARDPQFVSAGIAHAANFAMRQGGRNMLLALVAIRCSGSSRAASRPWRQA